MKLVIAEKPSVTKSIADVLGASTRKDGHLVGLATPEMYDEKYAKWQYDHLPILPSPWKYQIKEKTKKQYKIIKWYENTTDSSVGGTIINGETSASFDIPTDLTADIYYYYCVLNLSGASDVTTIVATVTVS